jgi:L-cysteine S-thiosulfotransferase
VFAVKIDPDWCTLETVLARRLFRDPHLERPGRRRPCRGGVGTALVACVLIGSGALAEENQTGGKNPSYEIVGDGIPKLLAGAAAGSAERGRALLVERAAANCLLCHAFPDPDLRVAGDVGPSLAGVGRKLSAAQLRLRIADIQRVNARAVMPSYYRLDALDRVAAEYRGKPVLGSQQVEDLVAYLQTLK